MNGQCVICLLSDGLIVNGTDSMHVFIWDYGTVTCINCCVSTECDDDDDDNL